MEVTKQATKEAGSCSACTDKTARKVYVIRSDSTEYRLCNCCLRELFHKTGSPKVVGGDAHEYYFIKTTGNLMRTDCGGADMWIPHKQQWREDSVSFLHSMIESDCAMELQHPFRGTESDY